ncbi:MAG: hypothetical protein C0494_10615 [Sphingobium sp.]|nr:hypothetical protein [Sphingobium sp.]
MLNAHALHAAAHEVADRIGPIEAAIDDSLAKTAGLLAFMPEARVAARLPLATGHEAMMRVLASLNSIAQARGEMVAAHAAFAEARDDLRIPEKGFGSLVGCPSHAELHVVTTQAA